MMPLTMSCPGCGGTGRIPDELQGKSVKCPKCGTRFVVGIENGRIQPRRPVDDRFLDSLERIEVESKLRSCPDCDRDVSRRVTSCPHCGCPLVSESQAPSSSPQQERIYFNERGVKVTNTRFIVPNQTYAINGINSVAFFEQHPHPLLLLFLMLLAFSAPLLLTIIILAMLGFSSSDGLWVLVILIVPGPAFLLFRFLMRLYEPIYWVRLDTSGGRVRAFSSLNRDSIQRIIKAVNDAIIARG
jgi:uncharacterized protein DUF6232